MKTYVLLHFEHKNDVTIIIKLHNATRLRLVAPYKVWQWLWRNFYVQNVIEHRFSWNKPVSVLFFDKKPPQTVIVASFIRERGFLRGEVEQKTQ